MHGEMLARGESTPHSIWKWVKRDLICHLLYFAVRRREDLYPMRGDRQSISLSCSKTEFQTYQLITVEDADVNIESSSTERNSETIKSSHFTHFKSPSTRFIWLLNMSRDGHSTTSLDSLFQCLNTFWSSHLSSTNTGSRNVTAS